MRFYQLILSLFLLTTTGFTRLYAQNTNFEPKQPSYELEYIPLPEENGKISIRRFAEDNNGFIWLATNYGLVCWDGQQTFPYSSVNNRFLLPVKKPNVNMFVTDRNGIIYMCTEDVAQFDPYERNCINLTGLPKEYQDAGQANECCVNEKGELFIIAANDYNQTATVFKKVKGAYSPIIKRPFNSRLDKFHFALADNRFVFAIKDSLMIYDANGKLIQKHVKTGSFFNAWAPYESLKYSAVFFDKNSRQLFMLNKHTLGLELLADLGFLSGSTVNIVAIQDSLLWISGNQQLYLVNLASKNYQDLSSEFTALLKKYYPLNLSTIGANVFTTRNGTTFLWTENVLMRLRKKQPPLSLFKETVTDLNHKSFLSFRALAEDEDKNIYASYYTGIAKQTGGKGAFKALDFPLARSLKEEGVFGLVYYNRSLYWNNVKLKLPGFETTYLTGSGFGGHTTLLKNGDQIWLYPWLSNQLYLTSPSLKQARMVADFTNQGIDNITCMVADPDGRHLWYSSPHFITKIDTAGRVVKAWGKDDFKELIEQVHCLYLKDSLLWFGCDQGLGSLHLKTYDIQLYKNPLVNAAGNLKNVVVFSMLPYHDSLLILGGNMGIHQFNLRQHAWYSLDKNHPLSQIEFNRSSTLLSSSGKYYFGSIDGLYSFYPDQLSFTKTGRSAAVLQLVGISWYDQEKKQAIYRWDHLSTLSGITLAPEASNLELLFSVPDLNNNTFYSYRIPGYKDQWQEYSNVGKIAIGNLPPGNYSVEIKAAASLNDNKPVFYRMQLKVKQHWYTTWWFNLLSILLLSGVVIWAVKRRVSKRLASQQALLKQQQDLATLRTKISSDLHDDVGSILTGLAMQSQNLAVLANEATKKELYEIAEMSRAAMDSMRDTVWAIDSRKDKYVNLVDRMRSSAEQQLATKNISHHFTVEIDNSEAFIDPVKRQHIYLIFKELITNIVRHSDAKTVAICFTKKQKHIQLLVHDDGTIQPKKNTDGLGMSNIRLRASILKGSFTCCYENGFKAELELKD